MRHEHFIRSDAQRLRAALIAVSVFIGILWLIKLGELALGMELGTYGVFPRTTEGLRGILLAPLLHGSVTHLIANTLPLFILGGGLLYAYPRSAPIVLPCVYLGTGVGVWLFARDCYHLGASGLTYGMMFFLFVIGILRRDRRAIALSLLVFFLYGGMIWGLLPYKPGISFETHLAGAVIGILLAVLLRRRDVALPEKRYDWEDADTDVPDTEIGDAWRAEDDGRLH